MEAVKRFKTWHASGAGTDEHLADQLVLPCSVTRGTHRWTVAGATEHLRTMMWVVQQFLPVTICLEEPTPGLAAVSLTTPP